MSALYLPRENRVHEAPMPRRPRVLIPGIAYHVLNRAVRRSALFETSADYHAFENVMWQALQRVPTRLLAYCVMPNHWHLIVWPDHDRELSRFMHWLTMTHAQRWHAFHQTVGTGPVYQGRFKSIPIESDAHLLTACRYVERNPLRGGLVDRAEGWRWSSVWRRCNNCHHGLLHTWPVPIPAGWLDHLNQPSPASEL